jgi:L-serine/L-threonine ammonia-lyase
MPSPSSLPPDARIHVETPLVESEPLAAACGARVLLKLEALQPPGSFKARGMGAACVAAREAGATRVVCASGGNAGLAVAYAGRRLGLAVTIVVPTTTGDRSRELIGRLGADLVVHGASWDDAQRHALDLARTLHATCVHPFDDPRVWRGHATLVDEVALAGVRPGGVVVAVGGGGLLCGVLQGMHAQGWTDVPVVAVETEGAASFAASVRAGRLVTLDAIRSIATTLGARTVAAEALAWTGRHPIAPWVVSDRDAVEACLRFADDHRLLVEPACGAALAAVYRRAAPLAGLDPLLVIVCGGAGVTRAALDAWATATGVATAAAGSTD